MFQFYFDRRQGEDHDLGLHVERYPADPGDILQVKHIYPGHLVAKQNTRLVYWQLPEQCLLHGDFIDSVNGKRDHDSMLHELCLPHAVHMRVARLPAVPPEDSEVAVKTKKAQKLTKAVKPLKAMKDMKVAASAAQKTSAKAEDKEGAEVK